MTGNLKSGLKLGYFFLESDNSKIFAPKLYQMKMNAIEN